MGCMSTKEKYNVNKEERGLRAHRTHSGQSRFSDHSEHRHREHPSSRRTSQTNGFTVTLIKNNAEANVNAAALVRDTHAHSEHNPALSARNQFDRASTLRRSQKKRRKSDENILTPAKAPETIVATPKTALEIVKHETKSLNNTNSSIGSRAEYNSSYGNLI